MNAIPPDAALVVVDMQRVFAEATPWQVPTFGDIVPGVARLVAHAPHRAIFTRFLTPHRPSDAPGRWRPYYDRWRGVTLAEMDPAMLDVVPALAGFAPPALVSAKTTYSSFASGDFAACVDRLDARTLIFCGVETDVCVYATAFGAMDRGLHVVIAADACTGGSVDAHRALVAHVFPRLEDQVAVLTTDRILAAWAPARIRA